MGLIKKAALAALGLEAKLREVVEDLVQKGEANNSESAREIKKIVEKTEEFEQDVRRKEKQMMEKISRKLNVPTRSDLDGIHRKLDDLTAVLRAEKRSPGPTGTPGGGAR